MDGSSQQSIIREQRTKKEPIARTISFRQACGTFPREQRNDPHSIESENPVNIRNIGES